MCDVRMWQNDVRCERKSRSNPRKKRKRREKLGAGQRKKTTTKTKEDQISCADLLRWDEREKKSFQRETAARRRV